MLGQQGQEQLKNGGPKGVRVQGWAAEDLVTEGHRAELWKNARLLD